MCVYPRNLKYVIKKKFVVFLKHDDQGDKVFLGGFFFSDNPQVFISSIT